MDKIKNNFIPFSSTVTGAFIGLYLSKGHPFMTKSLLISSGLMTGYLISEKYEKDIERNINNFYNKHQLTINYGINQGIYMTKLLEKKIKEFINR